MSDGRRIMSYRACRSCPDRVPDGPDGLCWECRLGLPNLARKRGGPFGGETGSTVYAASDVAWWSEGFSPEPGHWCYDPGPHAPWSERLPPSCVDPATTLGGE